jgi:AcrR family transcriptional regulator
VTGKERPDQLLDIGRRLFADRGLDGTSIEEIAAQAASQSQSFTNISAARKGYTPSSSIVRSSAS